MHNTIAGQREEERLVEAPNGGSGLTGSNGMSAGFVPGMSRRASATINVLPEEA
jgi:hypothetical protein